MGYKMLNSLAHPEREHSCNKTKNRLQYANCCKESRREVFYYIYVKYDSSNKRGGRSKILKNRTQSYSSAFIFQYLLPPLH